MVHPCIPVTLPGEEMGPASRRAVACCCCRAACMTYFWLWGLCRRCLIEAQCVDVLGVCVVRA